MNTFCKHSLMGGGKNKPVHLIAKGLLPLLLISACTTFIACNESENAIPQMASNRLNISVGIHQSQSRAGLITSATLPEASEIGIKLDGYDDADNIKFTAATQDSKQVWNPASDIVLDETKGTLYAYYPWKSGTDLSTIPVETASQTDYLYAEPVANVSEKNANVPVTMKHMLANVKIAINKGTYVGTGNISKIAIQSDGFATGGTFNAAQETPAYTATTGAGTAIESNAATTLGGTATDIMVVPTGVAKPITFTATIDDVDYTVTSSDVTLQNGNSYEYTLSLNSTFMSVSEVSVTPWEPVTKATLTLEKEDAAGGNTGSGPAIDATGKANGVYVVTATGQLVDKSAATPDCIGVAFISVNQKVMIAKTDATDGTNSLLYWCKNLYGQDVPNLEYLANDIAAKADYNGKANTAAIIAGYAALGKDMHSRDMCKVLESFNEGGYTDWYVPAAGQLYEFYSNKVAINEALTAISGNSFRSSTYWSSSEKSADYAWTVNFDYGGVIDGDKDRSLYVRFVRDLQ